MSTYLAILTAIRDVCKLAVKELTSWVCFVKLRVALVELRYIKIQ